MNSAWTVTFHNGGGGIKFLTYIDQYHGAPICMLVSSLRTRPSHAEEK